VTRDLAASTGWYLKAAQQGVPQAQFNVGIKFLKGEGIGRDEAEGIRWLHRAAAQGYGPARDALQRVERRAPP